MSDISDEDAKNAVCVYVVMNYILGLKTHLKSSPVSQHIEYFLLIQ
jgi:hypothetical protein